MSSGGGLVRVEGEEGAKEVRDREAALGLYGGGDGWANMARAAA